jgi:CheY-like chemotaxis protein
MKSKYNEVTLLIVDDDDVDVQGIQRAFKRMRILNPISRVKNGIEALEILRGDLSKKPTIVLLDLNMPVMDGFEFLDVIRKDESLDTTTVFVLTTSKSQDDLLRAYKKHIAGYVVKSEIDTSFQSLIDMLSSYWRVIELPASPIKGFDL